MSKMIAAHTNAPRRLLRDAPAPVDNPLKGLVPYSGDVRRFFPHSLEFNYLALSELVVGPREYDWKPLDTLLNDVAGRGHQAIFRVFLEYPGRKSGVPAYLLRAGLKLRPWNNAERDASPDYADPRLRTLLQEFIGAMGKRYDGDKRIGFVTAGLLGAWGEWHTYPHEDFWASKAVQREVMDAYTAAFRRTPVLLRYPVGEGDETNAANARRPFGYHDDSFAWGTLDTGRKDDDWFYLPSLRRAGAEDKWKRHPIGGEIRPEAWGKVFDTDPGMKEIQDFARCVRETHASWLMDTGMFRENPADRRARAETQVRRMGYDFHVSSVLLSTGSGGVVAQAEVVNRGVAPFYSDWQLEWQLCTDAGKVLSTVRDRENTLRGLLPDTKARVWTQSLPTRGMPPGAYLVRVRVVNPLPNGKPLRFANQEQGANGWLTLGSVRT